MRRFKSHRWQTPANVGAEERAALARQAEASRALFEAPGTRRPNLPGGQELEPPAGRPLGKS